jgi:hypothetical protein
MDKRPVAKVAKVIDFAAYRAANPRPAQPLLPFVASRPRTLTPRGAAHRVQMLRHLHQLRFRTN